MVTSRDKFITTINGYDFIKMKDNDFFPDAIRFYPDTGEEAPMGFFWELQHEVGDILCEQNEDKLLKRLIEEKNLLEANFNMGDIPEKLKYLLGNRAWFERRILNHRNKHTSVEFCSGMTVFIERIYEVGYLPPVATNPISFCPFCGVKLRGKFTKYNWWDLLRSEILINDIGREIFYVINGYYEDEEQ